MIPNFGDPSGQRHVGGRRRDTHTADKVLTHGQTLLFYRYRFFFLEKSMKIACRRGSGPLSVVITLWSHGRDKKKT